MVHKFPKGFDDWASPRPPRGDSEDEFFSTFFNEHRKESDSCKSPIAFFRHLQEEQRKKLRSIKIDDVGHSREFDLQFSDGLPSLPSDNEFDDADMFIVALSGGNVRVRGAAIRQFRFSSSNKAKLVLEDCYISYMPLDHTTPQTRELKLINCWIGHLKLGSDAVHTLTVQGGGIAFIETPSPDRENPFSGSVTFSDVLLPTDSTITKHFKGTQPYRNFRSHMEKLNNGPMIGLFRALELRSERTESDRGMARLLNKLYDCASGYGSSIGRPWVWFFMLYAAGVGFALCWDSGVTPLGSEYYVGWRANLINPEIGHWCRSLFLPLQSMISPAGVFGARSLVTANTVVGGVLFTVLGLAMDVMVFLSILAIRKRFKIPQ